MASICENFYLRFFSFSEPSAKILSCENFLLYGTTIIFPRWPCQLYCTALYTGLSSCTSYYRNGYVNVQYNTLSVQHHSRSLHHVIVLHMYIHTSWSKHPYIMVHTSIHHGMYIHTSWYVHPYIMVHTYIHTHPYLHSSYTNIYLTYSVCPRKQSSQCLYTHYSPTRGTMVVMGYVLYKLCNNCIPTLCMQHCYCSSTMGC